MSIKAIIIDDEINAVKSLQLLLAQLNIKVSVEGFAHNVLDGMKLIKSLKPDLVFLDIKMPGHNGFDLLEAVENKEFDVVFTTAHEEYALQGFKHGVLDYLLKPVDLDELEACIHRFMQKRKEKPNEPKQIKISVKDGILFLRQKEIIRLEADGSYSHIYMENGERHTISKNLKMMSELLDKTFFFRCHNSHIINLQRVKKFLTTEGYYVSMDDDSMVEVSRSKREELLEAL